VSKKNRAKTGPEGRLSSTGPSQAKRKKKRRQRISPTNSSPFHVKEFRQRRGLTGGALTKTEKKRQEPSFGSEKRPLSLGGPGAGSATRNHPKKNLLHGLGGCISSAGLGKQISKKKNNCPTRGPAELFS